jgi:hypothetical protein
MIKSCTLAEKRDMKTISVDISDVEYDVSGLSKSHFLFSEITALIECQITKQALRRCVDIVGKNGLSLMIADEIKAEGSQFNKG